MAKTAIEDKTELINQNDVFVIYPNPVESTLLFSKDITGSEIKIIDSKGNLVGQQMINTNSLDVSQLKSGMYFIALEKEGEKIVKRFIKK